MVRPGPPAKGVAASPHGHMHFSLKGLLVATGCICFVAAFIRLLDQAAIAITVAVCIYGMIFLLSKRGWKTSRVRLCYVFFGVSCCFVFFYMASWATWVYTLRQSPYWAMQAYCTAIALLASAAFVFVNLWKYLRDFDQDHTTSGSDAAQPIDKSRMTNSVSYRTCNLDPAPVTGTNPFTGETVEFPSDHGFTDIEREAVVKLLDRYDPVLDSDGQQHLTLGDGTKVVLWTGDMNAERAGKFLRLQFEGPANSAIVAFAHTLASVGNLSVGSTNGRVTALVAEPQSPQIRERWPGAPVLRSMQEFADWIQKALKIELAP